MLLSMTLMIMLASALCVGGTIAGLVLLERDAQDDATAVVTGAASH